MREIESREEGWEGAVTNKINRNLYINFVYLFQEFILFYRATSKKISLLHLISSSLISLGKREREREIKMKILISIPT